MANFCACGVASSTGICAECEKRRRGAAEGLAQYIDEAVAAGGVAWKCPEGHLGLFRAGSLSAVRLTAKGEQKQVFRMTKDGCPGCGE